MRGTRATLWGTIIVHDQIYRNRNCTYNMAPQPMQLDEATQSRAFIITVRHHLT